jgi:hypothetical protein
MYGIRKLPEKAEAKNSGTEKGGPENSGGGQRWFLASGEIIF